MNGIISVAVSQDSLLSKAASWDTTQMRPYRENTGVRRRDRYRTWRYIGAWEVKVGWGEGRAEVKTKVAEGGGDPTIQNTHTYTPLPRNPPGTSPGWQS